MVVTLVDSSVRCILVPRCPFSENHGYYSKSIWLWRRDRPCICGHWASVTRKQFLNWYGWVMPSGDMLCAQTAVPFGVNKVGVVVFRLNKCGRAQPRQTGPAAVLSTAAVSCDQCSLLLHFTVWWVSIYINIYIEHRLIFHWMDQS